MAHSNEDKYDVSDPSFSKTYNRPRRPNAETISYLQSLPLDVSTALRQVQDFQLNENKQDNEYPQMLAAALSAIDDIQRELASLAGDETAAEVIELLAHIACPFSEVAARALLHATAGYRLHLATHRYGSHVLQTLLHLAMSSKSETDLALHKDAPNFLEGTIETIPSLTNLLMDIVTELKPHIYDLAIHLCGSHVLRSILCALTGFEMVLHSANNTTNVNGNTLLDDPVSLRRGKQKNKKRKRKYDQTQNENGLRTSHTIDFVKTNNSRISDYRDERIQEALHTIITDLSGSAVTPPGSLQQLSCHSSAGPLLIVLLCVLTYSEAAGEDWQPQQSREESAAADRHLGKIPVKPYFTRSSKAFALAERLLCLTMEQYEAGKEQRWIGEVIYGLAGETRGSHLLETLLRLSPDDLYEVIIREGGFYSTDTLEEYIRHDVSNFVVQTLLATTRNAGQTGELLKALGPVIASGLVVDNSKKRRGILWRAVEAAAKYRTGQQAIQQHIVAGFRVVAGSEVTVFGLSEIVPLLLCIRQPQRDGDRIGLDVPGTRTLHFLLRFEPKLCKAFLKGILQLSVEDLELLSKDGLGSRCVLDGILDGPTKDSIFQAKIKQLYTSLQGRWVALACDRVGHHTVKKVFRSLLDVNERKKLVTELVEGKTRLQGCPMGRSVMEYCRVYDFISKGENSWASGVSKFLQNEDWLKELVCDTSARREGDAGFKKRRAEKPTKRQDGMSIESIVDTLTVPTQK